MLDKSGLNNFILPEGAVLIEVLNAGYNTGGGKLEGFSVLF